MVQTQGLQKLGHSIQLSYKTIKKMIGCRLLRYVSMTTAKQLDTLSSTKICSSISSLQYHLCELLGMARWYDRFGVLGLSPDDVQGL